MTERFMFTDRKIILGMSKKVLENLADEYQNVRKEVNDIMGGQLLEHEGKRPIYYIC